MALDRDLNAAINLEQLAGSSSDSQNGDKFWRTEWNLQNASGEVRWKKLIVLVAFKRAGMEKGNSRNERWRVLIWPR